MPDLSLLSSPAAAERRARAAAWMASWRVDQPALVVASTLDAAAELIREVAVARPAGFGWQRTTLLRLAASLAGPALAERGLAPVSGLALEALCARVLHELRGRTALGRLQALADKPGLPRALARTVAEVRMAGIAPARLPEPLGPLLEAVEQELVRARLADRPLVLRLAAEALRGTRVAPVPTVLLDLPIHSALERELLAALCQRGGAMLATVPAGDERSLLNLEAALGVRAERLDGGPGQGSLARVQRHLFADATSAPADLDQGVRIFSAPGEGRECVEIARQLLHAAEGGVPFDRMAVLLRAPAQYRSLLEEALHRAGIPAHFARGTSKPDPSGRAFLALLLCAQQGLSARRFAEYLSLGEVPDADAAGAPPAAAAPGASFTPPDEELAQPAGLGALGDESPPAEPAAADLDAPVRSGSLRAPWRWERLLVEAAVIGSLGRWEQRLDGHAAEVLEKLQGLDRTLEDEPLADRLRRELSDLAALRGYALPLLAELAALPETAAWADWLPRLSALATRALREPERVLALLAELSPLGPVGPVGLQEVRQVLAARLGELPSPPAQRRAGRVFVAPIEAVRGLSFEVVFAPGLAEKLFPPRLQQDPLLCDEERRALSAELETNAQRLAAERLALRLAAGAARRRLILSYSRLDSLQARPRVPSFYGLEVVRAATGVLPAYADLSRSAEKSGSARAGWPAPADSRDAIDEAEHDLALLDQVLRLPEPEARGAARYLLSVNPHLARSLRARYARFSRKKWHKTDGLVDPSAAALAALAKEQLAARSYSPTALQNFAACPYKFLLHAVHRLSPRKDPERIDELDPLSRGSLMHEAQFELLGLLQREGLLPVTPDNDLAAEAHLDRVMKDVAARWHAKLYPAIARVWEDGVASVLLDLKAWLRRMAADVSFTPWHFELSFGVADRTHRDKDSVRAPVPLDCGISLRGSIDLVEKSAGGHLRATDYKSGKKRASKGDVIGGGALLQPILYALVLEKLFPELPVDEGRLWYCTFVGEFAQVPVPLDAEARESAAALARAVGEALRTGFFPAAPRERECQWCDYAPVCGPLAEHHAKRKPKDRLVQLTTLRSLP